MARERYLVGVSKEELEYTPPPPPPSTPKEKFSNFWYHYKWLAIGALFIIIMATVVIVQVATKVKPDYVVCVAVQQELSIQAVNRLETELEVVGKDRNGDGNVVVQVQALNITYKAGSTDSLANRQALMAHIASRDILLFALDPSYYHETLEPLLDDGTLFFSPLAAQVKGISEDGTYWNWKDSPLLKETDMQAIDTWQAVPQEVYFGVRNLSGNKKQAQEKDDCVALLRAFIAAHS